MPAIRRNLAVQITAGGSNPLKLRVQQSVMKVGSPGTVSLIPKGGTGPYAVSLLSGALPTVCSFTASITGNVLTVTAVANGTLAVGQVVAGAGVTYGTTITTLGTGTGGTGTYTLSPTPNVASEAMTTSPALSAAGIATYTTGTLPTTAGASAFTAQVQDSTTPTPQVYVANFTATVAHVLVGVSVAPPEGEASVAYAGYQFAIAGATGTVTYSGATGLPSSYAISSSGYLSGTTTSVGIFPCTIDVSDSGTGDTLTISFSLTIIAALTGVTAGTFTNYIRPDGIGVVIPLTVNGGVLPLTFTLWNNSSIYVSTWGSALQTTSALSQPDPTRPATWWKVTLNHPDAPGGQYVVLNDGTNAISGFMTNYGGSNWIIADTTAGAVGSIATGTRVDSTLPPGVTINFNSVTPAMTITSVREYTPTEIGGPSTTYRYIATDALGKSYLSFNFAMVLNNYNPSLSVQQNGTTVGGISPTKLNFIGATVADLGGGVRNISGLQGPPGSPGSAGANGHGSTTTTAAPTASGGNWVFTVGDTTAFNATGLPIYCVDVANASNWIFGHVINIVSPTQLTVAPDSTGGGSIPSIANGSTFTFSGVQGAAVYVGVTTNSGNAYTATPSPAITSYVTGQMYTAQFNAANTGAVTLNISGLGAKNVYKNNAALTGGEIAVGATIAVTYDGTQFQLTGDGSGGGGLVKWVEAGFTASPNNVTGASSFTPVSTLTNADAVVSPKGSGALQAQVADGTVAGGNKRGVNSVDFQMVRSSITHVASGVHSVIGGGYGNTASGQGSTVAGGESNSASAILSTVVGGRGNIASVNSAVICGGQTNRNSGTLSFIGGGTSNHLYGNYASITGGNHNTVGSSAASSSIGGGIYNTVSSLGATVSGGGRNSATYSYSTVCGGKTNIASGNYSTALGGQGNTAFGANSATICGSGNMANGQGSQAGGFSSANFGRRGSTSMSSGKISALGDSQHCTFSLSAVTTSSSAVQMSALPGGSAIAANQLSLATGMCATFTGLIVAKDTAAGGNDCSHWSFVGGINNLNGTTTLTSAVTPTLISQTAGAASWAVSITADNTNKTLAISVSGAAAKTLHWSCFIRDVEVL